MHGTASRSGTFLAEHPAVLNDLPDEVCIFALLGRIEARERPELRGDLPPALEEQGVGQVHQQFRPLPGTALRVTTSGSMSVGRSSGGRGHVTGPSYDGRRTTAARVRGRSIAGPEEQAVEAGFDLGAALPLPLDSVASIPPANFDEVRPRGQRSL